MQHFVTVRGVDQRLTINGGALKTSKIERFSENSERYFFKTMAAKLNEKAMKQACFISYTIIWQLYHHKNDNAEKTLYHYNND